MPTCAVCILYTIHSIYIQCLLGHLVQPYIHTLPCHAPIIQSLQVAKEREKPMRKQLKALHYEATTTVGSSQNPRSSHNRTKACANKDIDHLSPISIHITR